MHSRFAVVLVLAGLGLIYLGYQEQNKKPQKERPKLKIAQGKLLGGGPEEEFEEVEVSLDHPSGTNPKGPNSVEEEMEKTKVLAENSDNFPLPTPDPLSDTPSLEEALSKSEPPVGLPKEMDPSKANGALKSDASGTTGNPSKEGVGTEEANLPDELKSENLQKEPEDTTTPAPKTVAQAEKTEDVETDEEDSSGKRTRTRKYRVVPFTTLSSYDYRTPDDGSAFGSDKKYTIPDKIQKLAGEKVIVEGYMLPVHFREGKTKMFLLLGFQVGCCFGGVPRLNEWVVITVTGDPVPVLPAYQRCKVYGTMEIGDHKDEMDLESVYRMKADKVKEVSLYDSPPGSDHGGGTTPPPSGEMK